MSKYSFWLSDALNYATMPSQLAYYLFFDNKMFSADNCLQQTPNAILGGAVILLSLPVDLLVGLFTLPVALFHDIFAFIGNFFDAIINDKLSSLENSPFYAAGFISLLPSLGSGAAILNSFGVDTGWFDGGYDPMFGVALIPIFILSLPLSLIFLILSLPIAAYFSGYNLLESCFDSAEQKLTSFDC